MAGGGSAAIRAPVPNMPLFPTNLRRNMLLPILIRIIAIRSTRDPLNLVAVVVAHEIIIIRDTIVHVPESAALIRQILDARQRLLPIRPKIVLHAPSVPFDEINQPRQQNRGALIYLHQVHWAQVLVIIIQNPQHSPHQHWLNLRGVHQHELQLKSHRIHQLPRHRPVGRDAAPQNAHHLEHLLHEVIRLDLLPQVDDVLLG